MVIIAIYMLIKQGFAFGAIKQTWNTLKSLFMMVKRLFLMLLVCEVWVIIVWNVVIFGVDNSSSRHPENVSNNFLVLSEWPTDDINYKVSEPKKNSLVLISLNQ